MRLEAARQEILAEHVQLRDLVSALDTAALSARQEGRIDLLRAAARALAAAFLRHIEHEESLLSPALANAMQVRALLAEHEAQRAAAERLLELSRTGPPGDLAHVSRHFCAALLDDMAYEEEHLLRARPEVGTRA